MSDKPLIGVTGVSAFQKSVYDAIEGLLECNYILLSHSNPDNLRFWLDRVDGIILPGGPDIHPSRYNSSVLNFHGITGFDLHRDELEASVIAYSFAKDKPVLGLCRGHQMLAVVHGIPLIQDIGSSEVCHHQWRDALKIDGEYGIHRVMNADLATVGFVNSFHHQAIRASRCEGSDSVSVELLGELTPGSKLTQKLIVEKMSGANWLSVQWHPEIDWRSNSLSRNTFNEFKELVNR